MWLSANRRKMVAGPDWWCLWSCVMPSGELWFLYKPYLQRPTLVKAAAPPGRSAYLRWYTDCNSKTPTYRGDSRASNWITANTVYTEANLSYFKLILCVLEWNTNLKTVGTVVKIKQEEQDVVSRDIEAVVLTSEAPNIISVSGHGKHFCNR